MRPERITIRVGWFVISMRFSAQPSPVSPTDGWPTDRQEFAQAVRAARKAASLSQVELAEKVGITEMSIRNIETGRTKTNPDCRAWVIKALSNAGQPFPRNRNLRNRSFPCPPPQRKRKFNQDPGKGLPLCRFL
jgi:DNA-binding XRE family transcriptional regulator